MKGQRQKRGQFVIIAVLLIAIMIVSIGALMYTAATYYKHEPWKEYLALIGNIELNSRRLVELSLTNYTNSLIDTAERVNETVNLADNCISDVDGSPDNGVHSNFTAQQHTDSVCDTLEEQDTGGGQSWISPTGHNDPGDGWNSETNAYDDDTGTDAKNDVPGNSWGSYLELTVTPLTCSKIRYYVGHGSPSKIDQMEIDIYDTTWTNIYQGAGNWNTWTNVTFTETTLTKMRFRFHNTHVHAVAAYVYEADFLTNALENYELDLEVQWTTADYNQTEEELCIRTGSNWGSEDLTVDVWNTSSSSWDTLIDDLNSSRWNNASISSYLHSSTFTIRFKGGNEHSDPVGNQWDVECSLIHVWSTKTEYIPPPDSKTVLEDNLQRWQTNLSKIYPGRQITLDHTLGYGGELNYTYGLAYDWCQDSSISAANTTFALNITSIGFTGYRFTATPFLNLTILPNCTSSQIVVNIDADDDAAVTDLEEENFQLESNNITSVTSLYSQNWTHVYVIEYEGNLDPPALLWVWDQRGIKVTGRINEDRFIS